MQNTNTETISLGNHWSYNILQDPKRFAFVLSRYKFAAKMTEEKRSVLELGCSSGIGAPMLIKGKEHYTGIDLDKDAIKTAKNLFSSPSFTFYYDDFMEKKYGEFDAVVSLDVIEHIQPEFESQYIETIVKNSSIDGVAIIGTPNQTSDAYASKYSKLGHVNLYTQERLISSFENFFYHVFPFAMNDEVLHTGFAPMAHYLFCVCCHPKGKR